MTNRDRLLTLAGVFGGIAISFAAIDAMLMWPLDASASHQTLPVIVKIGLIITPVSTLLAIFIRYRIVGVNRAG